MTEPAAFPAPNRPPDFGPFWHQTLTELARTDPEPRYARRDAPDARLRHDVLTFTSLGGGRVSGYLLRWTDARDRPLVIHAHGYGSAVTPMWSWARTGANVAGVDVRGHGTSGGALPERAEWGYVLTGIEAPHTHVLRGAVCDYIRAVDVAAGLLRYRTRRVIAHGVSFGGGLAVMAQALTGRADLLVAQTPSLGWVAGRRRLATAGSGREIDRYLRAHPDQEPRALEVLAYFDPMNFAADVRCPTVVGVGRVDRVVPAPTVHAIARNLAGPHEVLEFPVSHSTSPAERLWTRFDDHWLHLAAHGVPDGFGHAYPPGDRP